VSKMITASALIHLILVAVFAIVPKIGLEQHEALTVYSVELVQVEEEVAPVQEPAPEEPEVVEEPVEEEPVEEAKEEEPIPEEPRPRPRKVVPKQPPKPAKSLADRIAERMAGEDAKREPAKVREETRKAPQPASSTTVTAARFPYSWYLSIIQGKVGNNWRRPSGLLVVERSVSAVVSFRIARDGSVQSVSVKRSSGRPTVDQSAVKAVRTSAPFPALPSDYLGSHLDVNIEFTLADD
jgi:protein TonB